MLLLGKEEKNANIKSIKEIKIEIIGDLTKYCGAICDKQLDIDK